MNNSKLISVGDIRNLAKQECVSFILPHHTNPPRKYPQTRMLPWVSQKLGSEQDKHLNQKKQDPNGRTNGLLLPCCPSPSWHNSTHSTSAYNKGFYSGKCEVEVDIQLHHHPGALPKRQAPVLPHKKHWVLLKNWFTCRDYKQRKGRAHRKRCAHLGGCPVL